MNKYEMTEVNLNHIESAKLNGKSFTVAITGALTSQEVVFWKLTTPAAGSFIHWNHKILGSKASTVELWEVVDGTTGAQVTAYNVNRASANTAGLNVALGATITTTGTLIWQRLLPNAQTDAVASGLDFPMMILQTNQTYHLKVISQAAANTMSYQLNWHEATERYGR